MNLRLDKQRVTRHLLGLGQTHNVKDGGGDIAENTIRLLQAVAFGSVCHDKGDLVEGVRGLGRLFFREHLLGVSAASWSVVGHGNRKERKKKGGEKRRGTWNNRGQRRGKM